MRIAPLADVKARLSAYLDECGAEGPLVITRNGKAVAVLLVPFDDDDLERLMLGRSPRFQALLDRSRQSIDKGEGLSPEAFWGAVRKRATRTKRNRCQSPTDQALKLAGPTPSRPSTTHRHETRDLAEFLIATLLSSLALQAPTGSCPCDRLAYA